MQAAPASVFPWKIHRRAIWLQRWYEAWLVLAGQYTFWHAWHDGKHVGARDEYRRVVVNGGDLGPVLDAAIYATSAHITGGQEPQASTMAALRRAAWMRYESDQSWGGRWPV